MKKETVSKFDLEAAFKALDDIDIPVATGGRFKSTRVNLKERLQAKHGLETLVEDYFDVNDPDSLEAAKEEREAEVAKAKLARIEKIVDLDAETEDDILPSYVGKMIIQCPQCMTLFYKNEEDIEKSEETPDIVNINEVCQHCGNSSGYTLIGKVDGITEDEAENFDLDEITTDENELDLEFPEEGTEEVDPEGTGEAFEDEDLDLDLDLELDEVPEEEEGELEVEESLHTSELLKDIENNNELKTDIESEHLTLNEAPETAAEAEEAETKEVLVEDFDEAELDAKLEANDDYINYLRSMISTEEKALEKADNDLIKGAIQRRLDGFKADLEAALPEIVKAELSVETIEDTSVEDEVDTPEEIAVSEIDIEESIHNSKMLKDFEQKSDLKSEDESDKLTLHEAAESTESELPKATDAAVDELLDELWDGPQPTEEETEKLLKDLSTKESTDEELDFETIEDFDEESFESKATDYLVEVYSNVKSFKTTSCGLKDKKLVIEGIINFKSGKSKSTAFIFEHKLGALSGTNTTFTETEGFRLGHKLVDKKLITESFHYQYQINNTLVEGTK